MIGRPYAVFDGCDAAFVQGIFRYAAGNGIVDPYRAIGTLFGQHCRIGIAGFERAIPGKVQVRQICIDKRVWGDVDRRVQIENHIIQAGPRKCASSNGFNRAAQIQFLTLGGFKGALADGFHRGRQGQNGFVVVLERPRANRLQPLVPFNCVDLGVEKRIVSDGFQGRGEVDKVEIAGLLEGARFNGFQSFGKDCAVDGIIAAERFLADGFHGYAADGFGELHKGMIFAVSGDGAGGSVKIKPAFRVFRFRNHGVFSAGFEMLRCAVGILQRFGVGV